VTQTLTRKGQVTIPKAVRDHLGIAPGSEVQFSLADDGNVIIAKASGEKPSGRFASLRGSAGPGMSTDELMALLRGEPE
jgi:antitoxin PrlF